MQRREAQTFDRAGAAPAGGSIFSLREKISKFAEQILELKPQQTGTGLLIRYGEVATTSGSTNSLPGRLTVGHRPLKATMVVRIHPRQPITAR